MLTTRAVKIDTPDRCDPFHIQFQVLSVGGNIPFLSFEYPYMSRQVLQKFIAGEDAEDQDDDGVTVKMYNRVFFISIMRGDNGDQEMKLVLGYRECLPAFEQMVAMYDSIAKAYGHDEFGDQNRDEEGKSEEVCEDNELEYVAPQTGATLMKKFRSLQANAKEVPKEDITQQLRAFHHGDKKEPMVIKAGDYTYTYEDGKVSFTSTSKVYVWKDGEVTFHPQ